MCTKILTYYAETAILAQSLGINTVECAISLYFCARPLNIAQ